ncbi:MAG: hypothetical protein HC817_11015 [Saprospiraceae bacterium]|nr:hypothetical protein [Saprospiraceae bacterium]
MMQESSVSDRIMGIYFKFENMKIKYSIAFFLSLLSFSMTLKADTFVVTHAGQGGKGSFRAALAQANARKGFDKIILPNLHSSILERTMCILRTH